MYKKNSLHKSCKKPFFLVIYTRAYMYNHFDVYMSSLDQRIQLICSIKASHIYTHVKMSKECGENECLECE